MPESSTSSATSQSSGGAAPSNGTTSRQAVDDTAWAGQLERGRLAALRRREETAAAQRAPRARFGGAGLGQMALAVARGTASEPPGGLRRGDNEAAMAIERGLRPGKRSATEEAEAAEKKKKAEEERKKRSIRHFKYRFVYPAYATVWTDYTFATFFELNVYWFLCLTHPKFPFKMATWEKVYMGIVDIIGPFIMLCVLLLVLIVVSCMTMPGICLGLGIVAYLAA